MAVVETLMEITIYSVIIYAAIMLIKICLKNKISPFLQYAIWGIFLLRLMLPVTIESSVHFFTFPDDTTVSTEKAAWGTQKDTSDFLMSSSGAYEKEQNTLDSGSPDTSAGSVKRSGDATAETGQRQTIRISLTQILLIVWMGGVVLCLFYFAVLALLLIRNIAKRPAAPSAHLLTLVEQVKDELGIRANLKVSCQDGYGTPALLFPRTVFLPMSTLAPMDDEQIRNCVRHECMHYKRGDQFTNLLLLLLNAAYWFNPFVWLAFYEIRRDMESACDSAVVRRMNPSARRDYASLILGMFSQQKHRQIALGMVQGNTRKIAEKRIRGIFMNSKSNRTVKFTVILLTCSLLFTCFTTACQPTPEEVVVVGKNNDNLDNIIKSTPAPTIDTVTVQQNEIWREQLSEKNVTVNIDAEIEFPQVAKLPVVEVEPVCLTEDDAWKAIKVFFQDHTVYDKPLFTKEVLQAQIIELRKVLADIQSGAIDEDADIVNDEIEYYTELLQTAPSKDDAPQAIDDLSFADENGNEVINVSANMGNSVWATLKIARNASAYAAGIYFSNQPDNLATTITTVNNMEITLDKAVSMAQNTMSDLGIEDMILAESGIEGSTQEQVYVLNFIKSVNGIGISDYQTHMMTQQEGEDSIVAPFLSPEQVAITINDRGILKFLLSNGLEIGNVINENVHVLSIDKVKEIFREQVFYNYYASDNNPLTINIERVELGYFIQSVKDQQGVFRAIPVWDFLASEVAYEGDSYTYSVITINAIDGSIVNRALGY